MSGLWNLPIIIVVAAIGITLCCALLFFYVAHDSFQRIIAVLLFVALFGGTLTYGAYSLISIKASIRRINELNKAKGVLPK